MVIQRGFRIVRLQQCFCEFPPVPFNHAFNKPLGMTVQNGEIIRRQKACIRYLPQHSVHQPCRAGKTAILAKLNAFIYGSSGRDFIGKQQLKSAEPQNIADR